MEGTGGVRKIRWALHGRGKSGGARVIYYYHGDSLPMFLLTIFPKNEKANLTKAEKNAVKKRIPILVASYIKGREALIHTLTSRTPIHGKPTEKEGGYPCTE